MPSSSPGWDGMAGGRWPDRRRRVTLGLPQQHELLERVHEVFLAVPAKVSV